MTTFNKQPLKVRVPGNSFLSYAIRKHLEGANQTFVADAPLVLTGGYLVEAASPATAVHGFAKRAGRNAAAGTYFSEYIPAVDGVEFFANFLGAAAADNAIAIADVGAAGFELEKAAILADGSTAWYVQDATTDKAAKMVSFETDQIPTGGSNVDSGTCAVGDTNARPTFVVLDAVRTYK